MTAQRMKTKLVKASPWRVLDDERRALGSCLGKLAVDQRKRLNGAMSPEKE
jgi:hypothetical protein